MVINQSKLARQKQVIQKWIAKGSRGSFIAVTGFGKSFVGVLAIKQLNAYKPDYTVCIVVPSTYLLDQWKDLIKEHNLINCTVITIQGYIRSKTAREFNFCIVDEVHEFTGPEFKKVFTVKYTWLLCLSGSLDGEKRTLVNKYAPVVDVVTVEEALENKWVADFTVYNVPIPLSYEETAYLNRLNNEYYESMAIFKDYPDVLNIVSITGKTPVKNKKGETILIPVYGNAKKRALDIGIEYGEVIGKAKTVLKIVSERKEFFYKHPAKKYVVQEILDKFPDRIAMTFSQRTEYIDKLKTDNSVVYHSEQKVKEQKEAMKRFKELGDKCRCIHSGKKLVRGADFKDISLGIRVSYDSSQIAWVQTRGRHIRKEGEKHSYIFNLYMQRTDKKWSQEEKWLRESIEGNDIKVVWINDLSEIKI